MLRALRREVVWESLETLRQNYFMQAQMHCNGDAFIGANNTGRFLIRPLLIHPLLIGRLFR